MLAVTATVLETAAQLLGVHGLRAFDAVQLANAKGSDSTRWIEGFHTHTALEATQSAVPIPAAG
jgi:hypothetical protein